MTTEIVFRPGDRVRHSQEFLRAFARQWKMDLSDDQYQYIAQSEGRIMLELRHGQYMVDWQHQQDLDEDDRETIWHASDMQPI